jgi:outer membrane protein assembly factor BamB
VTGASPPTDASLRWKVRRDDLGSNSESIIGLAALDGHLVAVTRAGVVHSLNPSDGSERWRTDPGYERRTAAPDLALSNGTAYVSWAQGLTGGLSALDLSDGSEQWRSDQLLGVPSDPTLLDNTIYISTKWAIIALDSADGSVRWRFSTEEELKQAPAVANDTVYVGGGAGDGTLYAVDAETGEKRWTASLPDSRSSSPTAYLSSPIASDGTVYIQAPFDNELYAFNAADGTKEWSTDISGGIAATSESLYVTNRETVTIVASDGTERLTISLTDAHAPVVAGETLVLGGNGGVVCLDLTDGTTHWEQTVEKGIYGHERTQMISAPVVTDDSVFLGTLAGDIYAMGE